MRNRKILLLVAPLLALSATFLSGCEKADDADVVLRILNAEDYIYEYDPEYDDEYADYEDEENLAYKMDMLDQYQAYWEKKNPGKTLSIVYDTYDTNETMFNELKTGKTTYDVIIPSDYMVQKLASLGMLHKLDNPEKLYENISGYLESKLKGIMIPDKDGNTIPGSTESDYDYCVPYMWGTLGIMYNVDYYLELLQEIDPEATEDDVHEIFKSWDCLYGDNANTTDEDLKEKYSILNGTFSIKDSVRDTYTICLIHTLDEEVKASSSSDELTKIINNHDPETIEKVKQDMLNLKANGFGFETDSGKTDMTTEKIGANLCWSGDATWAITEARDADLNLYYSLPIGNNDENKSASNVWFDCFCMPKNAKDENNRTKQEQAQYDLAEDFIEFMSRPENAAQNCYCVGYTPAVAGEEMLDYMKSCYDTPTLISDYEDSLAEFEDTSSEEYEELYAEYIELKEDYEANGEDESCYIKYDLNYFFNYGEEPSDEFVFISDVDTSMRELRAQYPNGDPEHYDLEKLAIMNDFGPVGNQALLDMWEQVRTNPLPLWAIIVFIIEGIIALAFVGLLVYKKVIRKKLREAR